MSEKTGEIFRWQWTSSRCFSKLTLSFH